MADRLLVNLKTDGEVLVSVWCDERQPEVVAQSPLEWPLDDQALEDLRWYLEDYLRAPFGVYEDRGPQVQAQLVGWGEQVFASVFGAKAAHDAYVRARSGPVELVFQSASAWLLGLPWELLRDPASTTPLALDFTGVSRSLSSPGLAEMFEVPDGRLRILMVISRPAATFDVGYRMIARPLLERLDAVRGQVELVVLRPPTVDALSRTLSAATDAGQPFHVVHFDGHGMLPGRLTGVTGLAGRIADSEQPGPEGLLAFEKTGGGADLVPTSKVAQVVATAKVPVVVLNACQSGAIGRELEAAVATRLLQEGTASVVAMAYTVYAVAASEFMAAFYERLFAGDHVSAAVTAGRRRMFQRDGRPSPKGTMPLADWLVPVHYLRRDVSFPQARTARGQGLSLDAALDRLHEPSAADGRPGTDSMDATAMFIGRDDLFYQLEAAARYQHVVVLHGPGGIGKTELARAFGRWWRDTGGTESPDWVVWHSFEPGVASFGLDGMITQIGLQVFGPEFARLESAERRAAVEEMLAERRMLVIWDNFETVSSMPDPEGVTLPLDDASCQAIRDFLAKVVRGGHSAVIITSRAWEDWLGGVRHILVGGLTPEEAAEYADAVLAPYPAATPRRARRAFGELMEWLDGHPLSIRVTLPHLNALDPEALLEGLRGTAPLPGGDLDDSRDTSLPACIRYSYAHLGPGTRRLLPAVCLFEGIADAEVLAAFSQMPEVPIRFRQASQDDWQATLDDAASTGLLTPLSDGIYQIHPALPAYLAAIWRQENPKGHDAARASATRGLVAACADYCRWLKQQVSSGDAGMAHTIISLERRTFGAMLGYAIDHQLWDEAQSIAQALDSYWVAQGLDEEADRWTDRARRATEDQDGTPPSLAAASAGLWLFLAGQRAHRQLRRGHLLAAQRGYEQILGLLLAHPPTDQQQQNVAVVYHHLGMVAQDRGELDEAEDWYRKSLAITEELGDRRGMASSYHQLGILAEHQDRPEGAEDWHRKSLAIKEELGDRPGMASSYHQLGNVARAQDRPEAARDWHRKSLAIEEELGDRPGMASSYHQLGKVAWDQGRPEDAEDWYLRSLAIYEELGDQPHMASSYFEFGNVARDQGRLDDAEDWYLRSLAIYEELGDRPGMARPFGALALVAEERERPDQALDWTVKCVALFDEIPHPSTGPMAEHLAWLTAKLGMTALEASWRQVTGGLLPAAVRDYVSSGRVRPER